VEIYALPIEWIIKDENGKGLEYLRTLLECEN
jgi:hypothetical protein